MASGEAPAGATAASSTRTNFEAASAAFHEALRTDNANALFEFVAEDVLLMPPGEPPVRGKDAMREWYGAFLSRYRTLEFSRSDPEVIFSGDVAVELGAFEWSLRMLSDGSTLVDRGNYMQVWTSRSGGEWLFEREIWKALLDALDRAEAIAGIRRGLESMEKGKGTPAAEVMAGIRKRHEIPPHV